MRLKKWVYITPVVLALIAGGGYFGYTKYQAYLAEQARLEEEKKRETLYVSSDEKTVEIDRRDGEGSLTLVRGTPVETRVLPLVVKENEEDENEVGKEYRLVYINEEEYLMTDDELCRDVKDAVKEKSGFVTLPCVLYKEASGPAIAGMASKSAEAQIIGYGNLLPDGSVDRYQVDLNGQQGYLRPEYLVRTAEEVKDTVADFQYEREDLYGGGNAYTLEYPDLPKPDFADNHMPRECRTLYLNKACIEYIDDYIEIANNSGVNAFIIDMKESDGPAYESEVIKEFSPTSYQYAWNTFDDYKAAVQKCKDAGIYVIGRIVTFKDDLFAQDHPEMCLVDTATG